MIHQFLALISQFQDRFVVKKIEDKILAIYPTGKWLDHQPEIQVMLSELNPIYQKNATKLRGLIDKAKKLKSSNPSQSYSSRLQRDLNEQFSCFCKLTAHSSALFEMASNYAGANRVLEYLNDIVRETQSFHLMDVSTNLLPSVKVSNELKEFIINHPVAPNEDSEDTSALNLIKDALYINLQDKNKKTSSVADLALFYFYTGNLQRSTDYLEQQYANGTGFAFDFYTLIPNQMLVHRSDVGARFFTFAMNFVVNKESTFDQKISDHPTTTTTTPHKKTLSM